MSNKLKFGNPIKLVNLAADPSSPENGEMYYNTVNNRVRQYIGGAWQNVTAGGLTGQALPENSAIVGDASFLSVAVDTNATGDILADSGTGFTIKANVIVDADINSAAAIAVSKLEALTANRVIVTDASGVLTIAGYAPEDVLLRDGSVILTGDLNANGRKITNLASPAASDDAANKSYVDSVAEGLKPKAAARASSTADIDLTTDLIDAAVFDGITVATGDRFLVKNQTLPEQNGIYIVVASGTAPRAPDFDSLSPIDEINGAYVPVQEGTANGGKFFVQSGTVVTLGTDPINFVFFNSVSTLSGGDGIDITANVISVDHDGEGLIFSSNQLALELDSTTMSKSASGLKVATGGITDTEVNAAAAIALSKLAALTADRALQSNGSGVISASAVTNTELGYVSGVTSPIQTQLAVKQTTTLANSNILVGNASNLAAAVAMSGDATLANTGALTLGANAVSNAKLAQMAASTYKGNNTGSAANALDVTATELTADLDLFTSILQGLVPGSGGGTNNFLRADGTWVVPSGTGANTALSNLASVAINTSLLHAADNTNDLGSNAAETKDVWAYRIAHDSASTPALTIQTVGNNGSIVEIAHGTGSLDQQVTKRRLSSSGASSDFMEEQYVDSITLLNAQTAVNVASLQFAFASFEAISVKYKIKEATSNNIRVGDLNVVSNGSTVSITDVSNDTADIGVSWTAAISGSNVEIRYTTTGTGNVRTMRAFVQRIRT